MARKLFYVSAALLFLTTAALAQSSRHFTFHYAFTVKSVPQGRRVRVWFPAAHSDTYQDVKVISATGDLTLKRTKENRLGNELYFAESSNTKGGDLHFVVDYDVVRRERVTLGVFRPRLQDAALNKKEQQLDLAPEKLVPVTGLPADLAAQVTAGKTSTLDTAHAISNYVFD